MNAISLNNLWLYLQGLTLTAGNKKWLADHLYEEAKTNSTVAKKKSKSWPKLTKEDLVVTPEVMALVKDVEPLPYDFDLDKARLEYLTKKHG